MARTQKSTLEYIQIDCVDKTTFNRLNRKFGKEGRLFWIDLLRLLGRTNWYILDLSDEDILEDVMMGELDIDIELGIAIIEQLAKWGNICEKTWNIHKKIWCQNLIDRHIEVFKKRNKIPENYTTGVLSVAEIGVSVTEMGVSVTEMQQSKGKERKVKESKEKNIKILKKSKGLVMVNYDDILHDFNTVCFDLPKVQKITEIRKKMIDVIVQNFSLEKIKTVFELTANSKYLNGKKQGNEWKANFDWIFKEKNFLKILEGNYQESEVIIKKQESKISSQTRELQKARELRYGISNL